ncbi:MAG: hypothetical protein U5J95_03875 [Balneolaceae bacterium]|nr:hypothetical protein [Balneolaceae bacterium]
MSRLLVTIGGTRMGVNMESDGLRTVAMTYVRDWSKLAGILLFHLQNKTFRRPHFNWRSDQCGRHQFIIYGVGRHKDAAGDLAVICSFSCPSGLKDVYSICYAQWAMYLHWGQT